ncbi:MAG TPA: type II secretion system protein [Candidatus Saccharimonadia bacterium]|nr:type II secretion system protein [Candidatus Saccharimonadia bacterium]
MNDTRSQSGYIMLTVLVMAIVLSMLGAIGAQVLINNGRFTKFEQRQSAALDVAEAGINYYLWHLAHNPTDYKDGGTTPASAPYGPYVHNYYDNDGNLLGTYTLTITPPSSGSTVTTIRSVGQVPHMPGSRTVLAQIGQPSFANYVLLTATEVWFGSNESTTGPVHSNVGVHFDGTNNGPVYAASSTYKPTPQFGGDGTVHNGVWGNGGPTSQWQYPVPAIDFTKVTTDLQTLSAAAQANGVYLAKSPGQGYYLLLRSDGTVDVYKVNSETGAGLNKTFLYNKAAPANGIFFVSDNVWVEGTNYPGRMSVVASRLPDNAATNASINIVGNITYKAKDGSAALGFIAQKDIHIADYAPDTLEIDGAFLAQKGHVWVDSNAPAKTKITTFGAIASYDYWTWTWVDNHNNVTAGYATTATNFDSNLIYAPPPQYPTTGNYSILNWREQLYNP